jgi:hypothetical protein
MTMTVPGIGRNFVSAIAFHLANEQACAVFGSFPAMLSFMKNEYAAPTRQRYRRSSLPPYIIPLDIRAQGRQPMEMGNA